MNIVKKDVKPTYTAETAFLEQRSMENDSKRLRAAVAQLITGKAHTATVAKVFALLVKETPDRIGAYDVERVLPGFKAGPNGYGW